MVELDWRVESRADVSLVELLVRNPAATARRVRVANRLDGPVLPPRREGVPEAGWDDGGFEGAVAADECLALGYAVRAPPAEPPAELVWTERAGVHAAERDADAVVDDASPEGVVRSLGDPRPPADAVPTVEAGTDGESPVPEAVDSWLSDVEARSECGNDRERGSGGEREGVDRDDSPARVEPAPTDRPALAAVARRIDALGVGRSGRSP
ncbi:MULTISPECIES: hypothetical protein [Halorussus]|uniref:DUF7857 domain-containing protein n=1 Tax=Halorussus TaxID=1070314 RepID=UPI000E2175E7|nr:MULTISPECIES: hypothetical protein [Halorussus]NHN60779.1 hypothetical protein [Halorussus sp. JP-T4]